MESQLFTKKETATTGSNKTVASIVIEEDMTTLKLTSGSISRKNRTFTLMSTSLRMNCYGVNDLCDVCVEIVSFSIMKSAFTQYCVLLI